MLSIKFIQLYNVQSSIITKLAPNFPPYFTRGQLQNYKKKSVPIPFNYINSRDRARAVMLKLNFQLCIVIVSRRPLLSILFCYNKSCFPLGSMFHKQSKHIFFTFVK